MRRKRYVFGMVCVLIATVLVLSVVVFQFSKNIRNALQLEIVETLKNVAEQNAYTIEREIEAMQDLLIGTSLELGEYLLEDKQKGIEVLTPLVEVHQFKRMAVADASGAVYSTDYEQMNLASHDNFRRSMAGEVVVTSAITDVVDHDDMINVISVPIYEENSNVVQGVLFSVYSTEYVQDIFDSDLFDGRGYSALINSNGEYIVNAKQSPGYGKKNVLTALSQASENNADAVKQMRTNMRFGLSGSIYVDYAGARYIYYTPVTLRNNIEPWYVITVVPEVVLASRLDSVMYQADMLALMLLLVTVIAGSLYIIVYRNSKKQLKRLAYVDPLTESDNVEAFKVKMLRLREHPGYVVYMDIKDFKIVNNTCGVEKGDQVICEVAKKIAQLLHEKELVARVSGDDFVIFIRETNDASLLLRVEDIENCMKDISEELSIPRIAAYFGIYPTTHQESVEEAIGHAKRANQFAKQRSDQLYRFYNAKDYEDLQKNKQIEDAFEPGIQNHEFEIWYQPKYGANAQSMDGAEALVRWRKKDGTVVSPGDFIPLFEKNGMISILDEYVFEEVCKQQKRWQDEGMRIVPVSVNISRASLYYLDIVERYMNILNKYQLDIQYIQLEITESAMEDNDQMKALIQCFRVAGFKLLLDDFGNGYSSLATLNMAQFDELKLDKGLIDHIGDDRGEKLLYFIIALARSLGLYITAEGVETKEQFRFLQKMKCNTIQGYYFSKPLPKQNYGSLLAG